MKIAIVGAGAMGSIYAGLMADAGSEVWAIDTWAEHIDAIKANGLRVEGASGDRTVKSVQATTSTEEPGTCDLVIIATKASGVESAARSLAPLSDDNTLVLTIQNGVGAGDRISKHMAPDNVLLGVAQGFGASMKGPGHAHHNGMSLIRIGEMKGGSVERSEKVAEVWRQSGFEAKAFEDINQLIWEKLICNVAFSGPCAVFHRTIGEIMAEPNSWHISRTCAREAFALAKAKGIRIDFDDADDYVTVFGNKMPNARPSMLLDHIAKRPSEVDFINGAIPPLSDEMGLSAPYNEVISGIARSREAEFG